MLALGYDVKNGSNSGEGLYTYPVFSLQLLGKLWRPEERLLKKKKASQKDAYRDTKVYNEGEWGVERLIDPNIDNINMILQRDFSS